MLVADFRELGDTRLQMCVGVVEASLVTTRRE